MENLEQKLLDISNQKSEYEKEQQTILNQAIQDAALYSLKCSSNQNTELISIIPEINNIGEDEKILNPNNVVEFKDGKPIKLLKNHQWDNSIGILPQRKVMGQYLISLRIGYYYSNGVYFRHPNINKHRDICQSFCKSHNSSCCNICEFPKDFIIKNPGPHGGSYSISSALQCKNFESNDKFDFNLFDPKVMEDKIIKGQNSLRFIFEIDNYLNLYHPETGLYLMFNKTAFPMLPFWFFQNTNNKIFNTKIWDKLPHNLILNTNFHNSIDQQTEFFQSITEIIPSDYNQVFDLFNRFRKFKSFNFNPAQLPIKESSDDPQENNKDKLINGFKLRLQETIIRAEKAEEIMSQMLEDYKGQSILLKETRQEFNTYKLDKEKEIEELVQQRLESKYIQDNNIIEELEAIKRENFSLKQKMLEIEKIESEKSSLGLSVETLKMENKELSRKYQKIQDTNNGLISKIQEDKEKINKSTLDNKLFHQNYLELETLSSTLKSQIEELRTQINDKTEENIKLTTILEEQGNQSSNILENALSDKITSLEEKISNRDIENANLKAELNVLNQKVNKYQTTLKGLVD